MGRPNSKALTQTTTQGQPRQGATDSGDPLSLNGLPSPSSMTPVGPVQTLSNPGLPVDPNAAADTSAQPAAAAPMDSSLTPTGAPKPPRLPQKFGAFDPEDGSGYGDGYNPYGGGYQPATTAF